MRPDDYGPDAVIADREEDYREACIRSGASNARDCCECGDLVPLSGPDLCDWCLKVTCCACDGRRRVAEFDPSTASDVWVWCSVCGGEGQVTYAEARKLRWEVTR